jgi:hypothetical protein
LKVELAGEAVEGPRTRVLDILNLNRRKLNHQYKSAREGYVAIAYGCCGKFARLFSQMTLIIPAMPPSSRRIRVRVELTFVRKYTRPA